MSRREVDRLAPWALAVGAAAGATAVAYSVLRAYRSRWRERPDPARTELDRLEEMVVEALRRDPVTGSCAIDVAALSPGIVELSGLVPTTEAAQRAARVLHAVPGVRTVINRLEEGSVEERLAASRARRARGEPASTDHRWYGMRVGTGARRQSLETDPGQPDDSVERRARELEVSKADVADAT